jgi:hypothetical protein
MSKNFRTMIIPDSVVATVRALADSFGPAASGMWTTPLSATGNLPATHWISTGMVSDDFASVLPFSHYDDSEPPVWVTDPYDAAAFVTLCQSAGITPPPVAQIAAIMGMVDVSAQEPFVAMARMSLNLVSVPL